MAGRPPRRTARGHTEGGRNGQTVINEEIQRQAREEARPQPKANGASSSNVPHRNIAGASTSVAFRRLSDLRTKTFPALAYVVPGIIAEGCTLLAGRPKVGKSW